MKENENNIVGDDGNIENDYVTAIDEDGRELRLKPIEFFFYNGDEYALLSEVNDEDGEECADVDEESEEGALGCFVCKVTSVKDENGDEMDEFEPVDDEELAEKLIEIANTKQTGEEG